MKKTILYAIFFIVLGVLVGNYFNNNIKAKSIFNEKNTYYFLQEGIYSSKEIMDENTKDIKNKIIITKNNKYYVYVGITSNIEIANRIKSIYEKDNYQIYIKEQIINNKEFTNNLEQFDLLINSSSNDEDILTIEEVVLSNYEEIIENNK